MPVQITPHGLSLLKQHIQNLIGKNGLPVLCSTVAAVEDVLAMFLRHYPAFQKTRLNVSELAKACNLSRTTVYKYLALLVG